MGLDGYQPGHDEGAGMVDQAVAAAALRRARLGAGVKDGAALVVDERRAALRLVLPPGEQLAATDECLHRRSPPGVGRLPPSPASGGERPVNTRPRQRAGPCLSAPRGA